MIISSIYQVNTCKCFVRRQLSNVCVLMELRQMDGARRHTWKNGRDTATGQNYYVDDDGVPRRIPFDDDDPQPVGTDNL